MRIRRLDITNFRGIKSLTWHPSPGINCLIGPGDSGKSTVLDAIDLCLGARRTAAFTDVDFHSGSMDDPIEIVATIGALPDTLQSLEVYGPYLQGFDADAEAIDDEPGAGLETVLSVRLRIEADLEPVWDLASKRAQAQGASRSLAWADRARLAPTRIGALADGNLAWQRGSVISCLTKDDGGMVTALRAAGRSARAAFGDAADEGLEAILETVKVTADELGVPIGDRARAMLDARAVNFAQGAVSLHDESGIPLRALGIGSARLLAAGLQRKAGIETAPLLVDELEHGLEPHRIIRLLGSLGAKETEPPLQVFATTHSPVVVRELSTAQLTVVRNAAGVVTPRRVPTDVQGTTRLHPDAFLARSVLVCEGASEVGFVRGFDQFTTVFGRPSLFACGVALVDAGGETKVMGVADAFQKLGYRTAILRDNDMMPNGGEAAFERAGGSVFTWRPAYAIENELFFALPTHAVGTLVERIVDERGEQTVNDQIIGRSGAVVDLAAVQRAVASGDLNDEMRKALGAAASKTKPGWFKSVSAMEEVARDVVMPCFKDCDETFRATLKRLWAWLQADGG